MQLVTDNSTHTAVPGYDFSSTLSNSDSRYSQYKIIRRNGVVRVICTDPRHKQRQG